MFRTVFTLCFLIASTSCFAFEFSDIFDPEGKLFQFSTDEFRADNSYSSFRWTTDKENEARFFKRDSSPSITIFGQSTPEINIRFKKDLFDNALIYIYNRADCELIRKEKKFESLVSIVINKINSWSKVKPGKTLRTKAGGSQEFSKRWIYGPYSVEMKWSSSGKGRNYVGNYVNLFISRHVKGKKKASVSAKELLVNIVKTESGDVYIDNIPMVDQGPKGYCAVAAAARVFRYYGYETDMHRLANLAGTTENGTMSDDMFGKMRRLSSVYHTKFIEYKKFDQRRFIKDIKGYNAMAKKEYGPVVDLYGSVNPYDVYDPEIFLKFKCEKQKSDYKRFVSRVKECVKKGIPVIWTVQLGMYREPKLNPQASGGHLRLIIGYNEKQGQIIFSDTWGRGHEVKHLGAAEAWAQTKQYAILKKNK